MCYHSQEFHLLPSLPVGLLPLHKSSPHLEGHTQVSCCLVRFSLLLTLREKLQTFWIRIAAWCGSRSVALQVSLLKPLSDSLSSLVTWALIRPCRARSDTCSRWTASSRLKTWHRNDTWSKRTLLKSYKTLFGTECRHRYEKNYVDIVSIFIFHLINSSVRF